MFRKLRKLFIGTTRAHVASRTVRLWLELLEDRITPVVDTWTGRVSTDWAVAGNWLTPSRTVPARAPGLPAIATMPSTQNDTAVFSGATPGTNNPCSLTKNITVASLNFQNGYTGKLTILGGVGITGYALTVTGQADFSNASRLGNIPVNIQFNVANSTLDLKGPANLVNFNFTSLLTSTPGRGIVKFEGATTIASQQPSPTTAKFLVYGQMNLVNPQPVQFTQGASLRVRSGGTLNIWDTNAIVLDSSGVSPGGDLINSSGGTVTFSSTHENTPTIKMAFLNYGQFTVSGGIVNFRPPASVTSDLVVNEGSITLSKAGGFYASAAPGVTVQGAVFTQWAGTLTVTDNQLAVIGCATNQINGGSVQFTSLTPNTTGYGNLFFARGTVTFSGGTYVCRYDPTRGGFSDDISASLGFNVGGSSTLSLMPGAGALRANQVWTIGAVTLGTRPQQFPATSPAQQVTGGPVPPLNAPAAGSLSYSPPLAGDWGHSGLFFDTTAIGPKKNPECPRSQKES